MTFVISGVAFIVLLTLLVIVHELGHYLSARWAGVTVEEFGFGLPPRAKALFHYAGTLFSLNWIPFGGFVRLKGENSLDPRVREETGSFAAASIPARLLILFAGVCMNLIVAIALFTFGFWVWNWIPTYLSLDDLEQAEARQEVAVDWGLYVGEVLPDGGAGSVGVEPNAVLKAVNGEPVTTVDRVLEIQESVSTVEYTLLYGETYDQERVVRVPVIDGKTGIALSEFALKIQGVRRTFARGAALAIRETWMVTIGTVKGIGQLIVSLFFAHRVPEGIAGIVGIAQLTHHYLQEGFMMYLRLVALLSLSLAVLNVLPFPALDGGRMMFVLFEMFMGKPVNRTVEVMTNGFGIVFLLLLMGVVTFNDIWLIFAHPPA